MHTYAHIHADARNTHTQNTHAKHMHAKHAHAHERTHTHTDTHMHVLRFTTIEKTFYESIVFYDISQILCLKVKNPEILQEYC